MCEKTLAGYCANDKHPLHTGKKDARERRVLGPVVYDLGAALRSSSGLGIIPSMPL